MAKVPRRLRLPTSALSMEDGADDPDSESTKASALSI